MDPIVRGELTIIYVSIVFFFLLLFSHCVLYRHSSCLLLFIQSPRLFLRLQYTILTTPLRYTSIFTRP